MSTPKSVPRPKSHQQRSQRTEQVLLDAALRLFRERGVEAVTVADIAAAADVAPATIYRRFGDKEGLLKEAFSRFVHESQQVLDLTPSERRHSSVVQVTADTTALVLQFTRANQRLLQSSYAKALVDTHYASQLVLLRQRTISTLKRYLQLFEEEIKHPNPELALDFALRQAMAMVTARFEAGQLEVEQGSMTDAVFVRELMRSILSYLQVRFSAQELEGALCARGL